MWRTRYDITIWYRGEPDITEYDNNGHRNGNSNGDSRNDTSNRNNNSNMIIAIGNQDSSKGGAVESGCSDLYDVIR